MLSTTALLHPRHWPYPRFRLDSTKVVLLSVQVRRNVMAEESEEGSYRKRFVTIADDAVVDRVFIEPDTEECDERVDWDHP